MGKIKNADKMTKTSATKEYTQMARDLPSVNEPSSIYSYMSNSDKSINYMKIFDELIGLKDAIIAKWLNITTRTYRNYKVQSSALKDNTKEQVISILSLYKHGIDVFGSKILFEKWLSTPNMLLDNKAPMDFLVTISGIRLIDNRLTGMEFGENV